MPLKLLVMRTKELPDKDYLFALRIYSEVLGNYVKVRELDEYINLEQIPYRLTYYGRQYLADAILRIAAIKRRNAHVSIILTSADIYTRGMNYIFGLATFGAAVISSARIDPKFWKGYPEIYQYTREGREFFEKQLRKVLIHEFGHAVGLSHCSKIECVMKFSNSPIELYAKGENYCGSCEKELSAKINFLARDLHYIV